jgi:hypothetical protein
MVEVNNGTERTNENSYGETEEQVTTLQHG